jgi:hypothetical protein
MLAVHLYDIRWVNPGPKLPSKHTFSLTEKDEATWRHILEDSFKGNRYSFRRLLHDTFHVEAERIYGQEIKSCLMKVEKL